jgi:UDP-2,3-diacylglucosamine hydrolase
MNSNKKIYFASDFHLGVPDYENSLIREKLIVKWLDSIKKDAEAIYLVGDLFDFWFEYKNTIPKGFIRFLGKLAELTDNGIPIYIFTGNHDMWMRDYIKKELNVSISYKPEIKILYGRKFYIGHGDGLGPGDYSYKLIKKIFASPLCQWLFERIHPNLGISIASRWSKHSRIHGDDETFRGIKQEWLVSYCKEILEKEHFDFFIFGHRHLPLQIPINDQCTYINLGDWLQYNTYAVFDGEKLELKTFFKHSG